MANDNSNLDERITSLEKQVAVIATKVDALSDKVDLVVSEMRASRTRQDADMREIREGLNSNVRNMFITVVIAVGAMVVAVLMK
ncbi:MAG: hypothetical protein SR3Q1_03950 [Quinella sp. 3Q1]|nr:hypothetical protein [Quinella sp. 3Q1]MBR6889308.1 hypothetical protein [Selenomonadaceae bacterium]